MISDPALLILTHKLTHFLPLSCCGREWGERRLSGHLTVGQGQPNMLIYNQIHKQHMLEKNKGTHIAGEPLCPILVIEKVQEIQILKKENKYRLQCPPTKGIWNGLL